MPTLLNDQELKPTQYPPLYVILFKAAMQILKARRSSILPENLIDCAQLYDYYTNSISEGDYSHEAHVALDEVLSPAGPQCTGSYLVTVFVIANYVKLNSPVLVELMQPSKDANKQKLVAPSPSVEAGHPDDWSIDDFL
ncbi:hypothetical protein K438DRAFT_1757351 [Mycena galopus ATCC 62051]|nr:hypothetical protein K438DRAFT_1757351 [Mycena galopus ATCC 62051]